MANDVVKTNVDEAALAQLQEQYGDEAKEQSKDVNIGIPSLRIEHSKSGKHRFYLEQDGGATEELDNQIEAVVVQADPGRAWFEEGGEEPRCAAIRNIPTVDEPFNSSCNGCPMNYFGSDCKPNWRMLLLLPELSDKDGNPTPAMFRLPVTSLKYWDGKPGVFRLLNSKGVSYRRVKLTAHLEDTSGKAGSRYAVVKWSLTGVNDETMNSLVDEVKAQWDEREQQNARSDATPFDGDAGDDGSAEEAKAAQERKQSDLPF
jgi:hypothetical protein